MMKLKGSEKNLKLEFVKMYGEYIIAEPQEIPFIDEDDKIFYEVFRSKDANYIITGNKKHYSIATKISCGISHSVCFEVGLSYFLCISFFTY